RPVTRDLTWGVKVPLKEAEGKVIYVWFEAVLGYISSTKEWAQKIAQPERWKDYWQDENCHLIHFIGKDNIVFHAIMFPAILMAKGDYVLPMNVPANEYLNIESQKISTSRSYAIWLEDYLERFPPDPLRYCLASIAPETKDSDFSWKDFQTRNNSELVGILGNFVNRSLTFVEKHFGNRVPGRNSLDDLDRWMLQRISEAPKRVGDALEKFELRNALKEFMDVARDANKYFNDQEPWRTVRENNEKCSTTLDICIQVSKTLAILMAPFMPFTSEKLWRLLNLKGSVCEQNWHQAGSDLVEAGHALNKPEILFSKIDDQTIEEQVEKLRGTSQTPELKKPSGKEKKSGRRKIKVNFN
ncbi:MAG: methionine--tRNA ligase, partial [bacterium]